jgi:hypothetical protein
MDKWNLHHGSRFSHPAGSGKSRALEVTGTWKAASMQSINATAAVLFRKVSRPYRPPTILYDEIDTIFGPKEHEESEPDQRRAPLAAHLRSLRGQGRQIELKNSRPIVGGDGRLGPRYRADPPIVIRMASGPTEQLSPPHSPACARGHRLRDRLAAQDKIKPCSI